MQTQVVGGNLTVEARMKEGGKPVRNPKAMIVSSCQSQTIVPSKFMRALQI